jgi:hypothetical protein
MAKAVPDFTLLRRFALTTGTPPAQRLYQLNQRLPLLLITVSFPILRTRVGDAFPVLHNYVEQGLCHNTIKHILHHVQQYLSAIILLFFAFSLLSLT